ncbi:MAG: GYF domain-containing protein [Verrucomicrobiota bacterium]
MRIYLQRDGQQIGPYTEDYLRSAVIAGEINQFDLAQPEGAEGWQPLSELMPITTPSAVNSTGSPTLSVLGTPLLQPASATDIDQLAAPPIPASSHPQSDLPPPDFTSAAPIPEAGRIMAPSSSGKTGQAGLQALARQGIIIAGWFCFILGFVVMVFFSWPFYIHYAFFVAALLFSIELMWHPEAKGGLSLLWITVLVPSIVGFGLLFYQINYGGGALFKSYEKVATDPISVKEGARLKSVAGALFVIWE